MELVTCVHLLKTCCESNCKAVVVFRYIKTLSYPEMILKITMLLNHSVWNRSKNSFSTQTLSQTIISPKFKNKKIYA